MTPPPTQSRAVVGVLADTHDLLRPEALAALRDVDLIVHAGDLCTPGVLTQLSGLAPVRAVRGNNDRGAWARELPLHDTFAVAGARLHVVHARGDLAVDPAAVDVIISGHSHRPRAEEVGGVLWLNPGSAGPRRFRLPVTLARLVLDARGPRAEIVELL